MKELQVSDVREPSQLSTHEKGDEAADIGHKVVIRGHVTIENGKNRIILQNKEMYRFFFTLLNWMSCGYGQAYVGQNGKIDYCGPFDVAGKTSFMVLGRDTTHVTVGNETQLYDPIGTAPGTKATTITVGTANPSLGTYRVTMTGTWAAGTILAGTPVGEVGMYGYADNSMTTVGCWATTAAGSAESVQLIARACAADNEFTTFNVDDSKPITATWSLDVSYQ